MIETTSTYPILHPLQNVHFGANASLLNSGNGCYVRDQNGRRYLDANSGLWNLSLGYNHPSINKAIISQLTQLPYSNLITFTNQATLDFSKKLLGTLPSTFCKVAYTCTGSESVELAIKLTRQYFTLLGHPHKKTIVAFDYSYHGTYYGSMSASGMEQVAMESYSPKVEGFYFTKTPFCHCSTETLCPSCQEDQLMNLQDMFILQHEHIAAFLLEPILGSAGVIPVPLSYMEQLQKICNQYDVLLIFDEVATGFGRTGEMYAFESTRVIPDILCLAKGINGGYVPLGATIFNQKINRVFEQSNSRIEHLSTQNGNPISCAAGIATIEIINEKLFLNEVKRKSVLLKQSLIDALSYSPYYVEVRCQGLMLAIALSPVRSKEKLLDMNEVIQIVELLKKRGLIVYPLHVEGLTSGFILMPPLIITNEEIHSMVEIICKILLRPR